MSVFESGELQERMDAEAEDVGSLIAASKLREYIPALCSSDGGEAFLSYYEPGEGGEMLEPISLTREDFFQLSLRALRLLQLEGLQCGQYQVTSSSFFFFLFSHQLLQT